MIAYKSSISAAIAATVVSLLAGCMGNPRNWDTGSENNQQFSGYIPASDSLITVSVRNFSAPTETWDSLGAFRSGTTPGFTDCDGTVWYTFNGTLELPGPILGCGFQGTCLARRQEYYYGSGTPGSNKIKLKLHIPSLNADVATFEADNARAIDGERTSTCTSERSCAPDLINNCKSPLSPVLTLVVPCGGNGQACCADPPESCASGSECDWDDGCKTASWPVPTQTDPPNVAHGATGYQQDQNIPGGNCIVSDWTSELQGLASDGKFWYVTRGDQIAGVNPLMFKVPLNVNWNSTFGSYLCVNNLNPLNPNCQTSGFQQGAALAQTANPVPNGHVCGHWGDVDYSPLDGLLYVPMEQCTDGLPRIARYDTNLKGIDEYVLDHGTGHAAAVAVHPGSGEIYMMGDDPGSVVYVYRLSNGRLIWDRNLPLLDENEHVLTISRPQGMAFSPTSSKLYIIGEDDRNRPLDAFQLGPTSLKRVHRLQITNGAPNGLTPQETEGMAILDTGSLGMGQIHTFVYVNDSPLSDCSEGAWFKHITLTDPGFTPARY